MGAVVVPAFNRIGVYHIPSSSAGVRSGVPLERKFGGSPRENGLYCALIAAGDFYDFRTFLEKEFFIIVKA